MRRIRFSAHLSLIALSFLLAVIGCSSDQPLQPIAAEDVMLPLSKPVPTPGDTLSFVEPFETGQNEGDWSFYTIYGAVIEDTGGNPDEYVHDANISSFAPRGGSGYGDESMFTGGWKARNVISVGIDLRSIFYQWDVSSRYVALMIRNDAGTPDYLGDDWGAYFVGPDKVPSMYLEMKSAPEKNMPGWRSYDFEIDSQSSSLPKGWVLWRPQEKGSDRTNIGWSSLMADVSYIQFSWGDPSQIYILNDFDLGLDNPRITWVE